MRELSTIVILNRAKKTKLFHLQSLDTQSDDKSGRLIEGIQKGEFETDSAASLTLYENPIPTTNYRVLKSSVKTRLLNSLFLLDLTRTNQSTLAKAIYELERQVFWINVLLTLGARFAAIALVEKALDTSDYYEFTFHRVRLLNILRNHYALVGDQKRFEQYNRKCNVALQELVGEMESNELYQDFGLHFARSAAERPDLITKGRRHLLRLQELMQRVNTHTLKLNYYRLNMLVLQVAQEYEKKITACKEATAYLLTKPHLNSRARIGEFALQELEAHLYARDYSGAEECAKVCSQLIKAGKNNWFVLMELRFLLAMNSGQYATAHSLYVETSSNSHFPLQQDYRQQKWIVFRVYLAFALEHLLDTSVIARTPAQKRFDIDRLYRLIPTYKKDKQGYNIAILIAQILHLVNNGDFSSIISRMEALRSYRWRYMRGSVNRQTSIFFKMLEIMEQNSFDPKLVSLKSQKYLEALLQTSTDYSEMNEGIQILPLPELWRFILGKLEYWDRVSNAPSVVNS